MFTLTRGVSVEMVWRSDGEIVDAVAQAADVRY
jgi:hypothetical protein